MIGGESKPMVEMIHRGGAVKRAKFYGWEMGDQGKGKSNALFLVDVKPRPVLYSCALTHGWFAKPASDWRLTDESWATMLEFAEKSGRKIAKTPRSTGRRRKARQPKNDPRQESLFD